MLFKLGDRDFCAHGDQDIKEAGARRVQQKVGEDQLRTRKQRCGTKKKGCAGNVARDVSFDGMERLASHDAGFIAPALQLGTEAAECLLTMIAGLGGLDDSRLAFCE